MSEQIYDLAITGNILQGDCFMENTTLLVKDGKIACINNATVEYVAEKHIDAQGKLVLPGAIDSHVHSLSYSGEGFAHTTRSACAGGVTTIIDMPVDAPAGVATPEIFESKIGLLEKESYVDVALLASVKNDTVGHIAKLKDLGCCGFKLSLFDTDPDRFPKINDYYLLEAFKEIEQTGLTAGVHAENDEIVKGLIQKHIQLGKTYPLAHCETRPEVSETASALMGLEIAKAAEVRFHLYHISCSRSIDLANIYRQEGCPVTIETCPHYLVFSEKDMERLGSRLKINPPVRNRVETKRLWEKLGNGEIECVSSDHSPWPAEKKDYDSIFDSRSGAPGVETLFSLLFSEGVVKKRINIFNMARVLMENPAKIFGLYPQKGILALGSDADVIIIDPNEKWTVKGDKLHSNAGWTPYEGMELTGRVKTTIVRGEVVYEDGKILCKRGYGKFITPTKRSLPETMTKPSIIPT